jgi:hypothetical protein
MCAAANKKLDMPLRFFLPRKSWIVRNFERFYTADDCVGFFAASAPPICLPCASHRVMRRENMAKSGTRINAAYTRNAMFISAVILSQRRILQPGVRPLAANTAAAAGDVRNRMIVRAASGTLESVAMAAVDTE